ncbi:MAG: DUF2116 family Zn-ribbon domain-containing protein, partial [Bacteroidota bacterium]
MRKVCPECGTKILGRADKVYCSDQCRSTYNNKKTKVKKSCISNTNR